MKKRKNPELQKLASNRSPDWAFMEKFIVPNYDTPKIPYLTRWRIIQTPVFGIYLHKIGTPDPRDTLHNHPWAFTAIILRGGYLEAVPGSGTPYPVRWKPVRWINIKRFHNSFHWIMSLDRTPTWTLMFVGRRRRVWGYLDREGVFTKFHEHQFNDDFERALAAQGDAA